MNPLPAPLSEPPERLKKARLDNIARVPASLLSPKDAYQIVANRLPKDSILLVAGASPSQKRILESVASFLRTHSHQVITMPLKNVTRTMKKTPRPHAESLRLAVRFWR